MEQNHTEPQPPALVTPNIRHDGWTGEKIATFCEALAETAVVAEACEAAGMGISGAYAARRRSPVFAAAWEAALSIARDKLADTLLARSMEGNAELVYRDGELVGERHIIDNKLGLAILRRLDRLAETGNALHSNPPLAGAARQRAPSPQPIDWNFAIDALRTGDDEGVAKALALIEGPALSLSKGHKVEEVEDPLNRPPSPCQPEEEEDLDLTDRCWWSEADEVWLTDFPPPAGFDGYESRPYDDIGDEEPYARACTEEETAILIADRARALGAERAYDEDLRDRWFALLRADCSEAADSEDA